jgi:hypothetical protein
LFDLRVWHAWDDEGLCVIDWFTRQDLLEEVDDESSTAIIAAPPTNAPFRRPRYEWVFA